LQGFDVPPARAKVQVDRVVTVIPIGREGKMTRLKKSRLMALAVLFPLHIAGCTVDLGCDGCDDEQSFGGAGGPLNPISTSLADQNVPATFHGPGTAILADESRDSTTSIIFPRSSNSVGENHITIDPIAGTVRIVLNSFSGIRDTDITFGPADLTVGARHDFYSQPDGSFTVFRLALLRPGPGGSGLDYASYGVWERRGRFDFRPFANDFGFISRGGAISFGVITEASAVPTTGSASYTGFMNGIYGEGGTGTAFLLDGVAALTANFGSNSLQANFTNISASEFCFTCGGQAFRSFSANATISGNGFSGTASNVGLPVDGIGPDMDGTIIGHFYGPSAQEVGGVFQLNGDDGSTAVGAFAAKQ
jgi:hypothetical protein